MTDIARLFDFAPLSLAKSGDVDAELNQLVAEANKPFAAYRVLKEANSWSPQGDTAGDYALAAGLILKEGAGVQYSSAGPPDIFHLTGAHYAITGRTAKLNLLAQLHTNGIAPGITYTFGLFPVSAVGGAGTQFQFTLGTVTSGSTVAIASPSANTRNQGASGDFSFPADGYYALGVTLSGTVAIDVLAQLSAQLLLRWT